MLVAFVFLLLCMRAVGSMIAMTFIIYMYRLYNIRKQKHCGKQPYYNNSVRKNPHIVRMGTIAVEPISLL